MFIERVYRDCNKIVIKIQGLDDYEPTFALQDIPDAKTLIQKIKTKVAEIEAIEQPPPEDQCAEKFEVLKTALEGLDIGD